MPPFNDRSSVLPFPVAPSAREQQPPVEDQPRWRILHSGAATLSDAELLGLLLHGGGIRDATEMAQELLKRIGGLSGLLKNHESALRLPGTGVRIGE